jgi:creatinine amidohydrolase
VTAPIDKVYLAQLTGDEARDILAQNPVILLPMGSHEDQGPHAPMGDYLCADEMARRIALRARENGVPTLVASVLPFGGADYFGSMIGGIALSQATLRAVLADIIGCLLRHGLTRLVVINGHGGNVAAVHEVCQEVYKAQGVLIPSLYLWRIGYGMLPSILGADGARRSAGHGADPLTSVVMALFPELVRADLVPEPQPAPRVLGLEASGFATVRFGEADVGVPVEIDELAPNGVFKADPRLCSAETGAIVVERLTAYGADFLAHFAA